MATHNPLKKNQKVLYHLWLSKDEEKILLETIDSISSLSWSIIKRAHERGDLKKIIKRGKKK